jgi:hypothetical protein
MDAESTVFAATTGSHEPPVTPKGPLIVCNRVCGSSSWGAGSSSWGGQERSQH